MEKQHDDIRNDNPGYHSVFRRRSGWRSCHEHSHRDRRLFMGIAITLLGVVLLSKNMNFLSYELQRYVFTWEMILIVLGILFILFRGKRSTGFILLFIGGIFYMKNVLYLIDFDFWMVFWPIILIFAGLMIIFRHQLDRNPEKKTLVNEDHLIDEIAVFGGGDRIVTSQQFQGGKVTTIFGGLNFNMLKAKLAPGDNTIDVFCLFGGMKLIVPEGWTVKIKVMSFFGGFSDKHRYRIPESNKDEGAQLVIQGTVFFGGGEIKSYFD
jgi:predicted membrane protein